MESHIDIALSNIGKLTSDQKKNLSDLIALNIARDMKSLRQMRKVSLTTMSDLTGIPAQSLSNIESGKTAPSVTALVIYTLIFEVLPSSMLHSALEQAYITLNSPEYLNMPRDNFKNAYKRRIRL